MKLYIQGHNYSRGYAVSRSYSDAECRMLLPLTHQEPPVRFYVNLRRARAIVARWNRRFGS